jgi:ethanolamine utilization protein EutP (predicted NTPase)
VAVENEEDTSALLADVAGRAEAAGRADLRDRMSGHVERLASPDVVVVVAGEFKAGKSSLVNALVGTFVCPVDDDVATSVPTLVRFATVPGVHVRRQATDVLQPVDDLARFVTEQGNPDNREEVRIVEVGVPSPLLADGLILVDTPGVGGLSSTYASATMTTLAMADAVVFVSDASQEYTRPELEFLAAARKVCPEVVAVLSKVDVVPEWRRIRALDDGWLAGAGVPGPVVPTSAALQLRGLADDRADLRRESGLAPLVERLRGVTERVRRTMAAGALEEARSVLGQLAAPVRAEHEALADPRATIERLEEAVERARRLSADGEWAALLDDGMIDLENQVAAELARRMKAVVADADRTLRTSDPAAGWDEFGAALARRVSEEVSAVAVGVGDLAGALTTRLAEEFAGHEAAIAPMFVPPTPAAMLPAAGEPPPTLARATPWRGVLMDAGWGGLEALGVMGSILTFTSISLFNPFSLVIGVFIGGKTVRDARRRDVERRREQAVEAVAQYVHDAEQAADRELKATGRRVRRELRTTYQRRADALYRSARESLAAAQRTVGSDDAGRERRRRELADRLGELEALAGRAGG